MALSRTLQNILYNFYGGDINTYMPSGVVNISDNNVFLGYLEIKLNQNLIEYPVVWENKVIEELNESELHSDDSDKTLIIPLYVINSMRRRGKAPMLKDMLNSAYSHRLTKVTTSKGEVYYGNRSMILDGNLNVLILNTVVREEPAENTRRMITTKKGICNIHPRVFSNKDIISKAIISDIIPYYLEVGSLGLELKIRDMDWMIKKPSHPLKTGFNNDSINNLIEDNAEIILNSLL